MSDQRQTHLARIRRAAVMVELRMRFQKLLLLLPFVALVAILACTAAVVLRKVYPDHVTDAHVLRVFVVSGVVAGVALLAGLFVRLPRRAGTLALDRHHALADRLTNAVAFDETPASERTSLMEVAIDDACAHTKGLSPRRAYPLRPPIDLLAVLVVGGAAVAVSMLEIRTPKVDKPKPPKTLTIGIHDALIAPARPDGSAWDGDATFSASRYAILREIVDMEDGWASAESVHAGFSFADKSAAPDVVARAQLYNAGAWSEPFELQPTGSADDTLHPVWMGRHTRSGLLRNIDVSEDLRLRVELFDRDGATSEPIATVDVELEDLLPAALDPSTVHRVRVADQAGGAVLYLGFKVTPKPMIEDYDVDEDLLAAVAVPDGMIQTPELDDEVRALNDVVRDLFDHRLDREEAFRKLEAIERGLKSEDEAKAKALQKELEEMAAELEKSEMAKPLADELKKNDLKKAEEEMKKLSERLKDKKKPPNKAEIEKLRKALEKAVKERQAALDELDKRREELQEQLLKKKQEIEKMPPGPKREEEERLLKKKERELERLDREREQRANAQRELSRLDRELAQAAADLMKELGASAEDLERAAEDINRMQQEQMSDEEKEELRRRIEELKQMLRQEGQSGKERKKMLKRFTQRARGQQGKGQQQPGKNGEKGKQRGSEGEGQDGEGEGEGNGQKPGGKGDPILVLGPDGQPIPMPGQGNDPGGSGQEPGGKEWGTGAGGPLKGNQTDPKMGTHDVEMTGMETNQGPSNSEVILSAAERGFQGSDYEKVFKQYRTVAEESINKDQIPDGYRFYVQRYFQLIRPRE